MIIQAIPKLTYILGGKKKTKIKMPPSARQPKEFLVECYERKNRDQIEMSKIKSDFSNAVNYACDNANYVLPFALGAIDDSEVSKEYNMMIYDDVKEADFNWVDEDVFVRAITVLDLDRENKNATIRTYTKDREFPIECVCRFLNEKPVYINESNANTNWQNIYNFNMDGKLESYLQTMSEDKEMVNRFFKYDDGKITYCLDKCDVEDELPKSAKDLYIFDWNNVLLQDKASGFIPSVDKVYDVVPTFTPNGIVINRARLIINNKN